MTNMYTAAALTEKEEAGAPANEIEITPRMVEAGLKYLEDRGLNDLTTRTSYPDFVIGFYKAVVAASRS
jgi:hypothetical protein